MSRRHPRTTTKRKQWDVHKCDLKVVTSSMTAISSTCWRLVVSALSHWSTFARYDVFWLCRYQFVKRNLYARTAYFVECSANSQVKYIDRFSGRHRSIMTSYAAAYADKELRIIQGNNNEQDDNDDDIGLLYDWRCLLLFKRMHE